MWSAQATSTSPARASTSRRSSASFPDIEINPNPTEVAQWFEAPLDFVLDPANQKQHWIEFEGAMHRYWGIQWGEHNIWGVTAAILVNLSRRLRWHG